MAEQQDIHKSLSTQRLELILKENTFPVLISDGETNEVLNGYSFTAVLLKDKYQVGIRIRIIAVDVETKKERYVFEVENQFLFKNLFASEDDLLRFIYGECYSTAVQETNKMWRLIKPNMDYQCTIDVYEAVRERIIISLRSNEFN